MAVAQEAALTHPDVVVGAAVVGTAVVGNAVVGAAVGTGVLTI